MILYKNHCITMENLENIDHNTEHKRSLNIREKQTSALLSLLIQKNPENFDESIANKLIKLGHIEALAKNLSKFSRLSNDIALILIKKWYVDDVAIYLSSFQWLDKNTAKAVIADWYGCFKLSLKSFSQLDNYIANVLIKHWDYNELAHNIRSFVDLNDEIFITLLVKCTKYKQFLLNNRFIFLSWLHQNDSLLRKLKKSTHITEYKKLKEFYDNIQFEQIKAKFESNYKFEKWFDIETAKIAIQYHKWKYVIEFLDQFEWDYKELINLLIEKKYINELKDNLSKLRGKNIDRYKLVFQISLTNDYNILIENSEQFEDEWISNLDIAYVIIKNCDLDCRDSIKKLDVYTDNEDWNRFNYNLDLYNAAKSRNHIQFTKLIRYFIADYSPITSNKKLPLKLKNFIKEKFQWNITTEYDFLFD